MESVLKRFPAEAQSTSVAILDPPRNGLHTKVLSALRESSLQRIVYISCNPDTLVDNLLLLEKDYDIKAVQPVDMFPFTSHVECVTILERKNIEK